MDYLINYVKKNKDLTYDELPFNEVDAAIYTILPYLNFVGLLNMDITIKDAYQLFNERISLKIYDFFTKKNVELFKELALSNRYKDNILDNYKLLVDNNTQFGAITIIVPGHFKFIAYEGTSDELIGWKEDFSLAFTFPVKAQCEALKYASTNISLRDKIVYLGGHSKGGNLAMYAGAYLNLFKRFKIKKIYNFDGPGFLNEHMSNIKKVSNKIISYYPSSSIIGMLLNTLGEEKIIKSSAYQIFQHDIHTWKIENNAFKENILSDYSKNIKNKSIHILNKYNKEELEYIINIVFNILDSAGYIYKSELKKLDLTKIKSILSNMKELKKSDKAIILDIFKTFIINK